LIYVSGPDQRLWNPVAPAANTTRGFADQDKTVIVFALNERLDAEILPLIADNAVAEMVV
jgi:hypothetical protein